jgi:hypothetical protein
MAGAFEVPAFAKRLIRYKFAIRIKEINLSAIDLQTQPLGLCEGLHTGKPGYD